MSAQSRPARRFAAAVLLSFGVLLFPDLSSYAVTGVPVACTPDAGFDKCAVFEAKGLDQTWTVPTGVTQAKVQLWGAGGAGSGDTSQSGSTGGAGGYASGLVTLTPGATYVFVVGSGGLPDSEIRTYGGGGAGGVSGGATGGGREGGSGGGLTGLFSGTAASAPSALLIAGGGGGAGITRDSAAGVSTKPVAGGGGGAVCGNDAEPTISGRGGSASAPGAGATDSASCTAPGAGAQLLGGAGADTIGTTNDKPAGGGGGGGWYGGGGGRCGDGATTGHGGGGSGYANSTLVSSPQLVAGANGTYFDVAAPSSSRTGPAAPVSAAAYTKTVPAAGGTVGASAQGGSGLAVVQWRNPAAPTPAPAPTQASSPTPSAAPTRTAAPAPAASVVPSSPAPAATPAIVPASFTGGLVLPPGQAGVPYTGQLPPITGGSGPLTCSASGLPTGLNIDPAKCLITGVPTQVGTSQVTVQIAGVNGIAGSGSTVFEIKPAEVKFNPPHGTVGDRYKSAKPRTGLQGKVTWTARGLPEGLKLNAHTGRITGVPQASGRFTVTLRGTNNAGFHATTKVRVVVRPRTGPPQGATMPATGSRIEVRRDPGVSARRIEVRRDPGVSARRIEVRRDPGM